MPTFIYDDYYGDQQPGLGSPTNTLTYLPVVNQWDPIGGTCPGCTLSTNLPPQFLIDPAKVQNGTWHSTTVSPGEPETTISITFNGTGVSAYCLLPPNFGPDITSYMNMTFQLDGRLAGSFERTTGWDKQWTYNHSVYSISGLENKEHTFVIQPRADVNTSFIAFDYVAYESDGIPSPVPASNFASSSHTKLDQENTSLVLVPTSLGPSTNGPTTVPAGAVAGGVIGGVLTILLVVLALWYMTHRRPHRNRVDKIYSRKKLSLDLEEQDPPLPAIPLTMGVPGHGSAGSPSSRDGQVVLLPPGLNAHNTSSPSVCDELSSQLPDTHEERRLLHEVSLRRVSEVEGKIAEGTELNEEEIERLKQEIETLRIQVEILRAVLGAQGNTNGGVGYDEQPPRYELEAQGQAPAETRGGVM